jgi:uncharacterized membrane protein YagU involved in acid resistance
MLQKIFTWLQGRHTGFAVYFAVVGTVLQCYHKLDMNYIALIGAIQAFVLGHSIKCDYFESKNPPVPPNDKPVIQ